MSTEQLAAKRNGRKLIAYVVLLLSFVGYVAHGVHDERRLLHSLDFKTLYGCARCLTHACDPYNSDQIYLAYLAGGGDPGKDIPAFRPNEPVYMPQAIALMTPLTLLRWRFADRVWLTFSTAVFLLGVWLIATLAIPNAPLMSAAGIALLLVGSTMPFMLAQPAQLVNGLCAIAAWCFFRRRYEGAGVVCLAVALAFKPHVVALVWLYFLLARNHRRRALQVLALTAAICLEGALWAGIAHGSSHWLQEMRTNLAALSAPGKTNDPGPTNPTAANLEGLQSIVSVLDDNPRFFVGFSHAVGLLLLLAWFAAFVKTKACEERDYLGLASVVLISMLPVYHRDYDVGILVLIFPAAALLSRLGGMRGRLVGVATMLAMVAVGHDARILASRFLLRVHHTHLGELGTIFWMRSVSWASLLLAFLYLVLFCESAWRNRAAPDDERLLRAMDVNPRAV